MKNLDEILVVLVIYEMDLQDSRAYRSLHNAAVINQKKITLLVHDNSKLPQHVTSSSHVTIEYSHHSDNPGVSRAYNEAARRAKELDVKWLLFSDQDTFFPDNIFDEYLISINNYPDCGVFVPTLVDKKGIISPFKRSETSGIRLKTNVSGKKSMSEVQAINSGLMVSLAFFERVGGYDERLHLDFSDFSFFNRLRRYTTELVVINAVGDHQHSSTEKVSSTHALKRFNSYLQSARIMQKDYPGIRFRERSAWRAVKLSIQHRSFKFIGSLLSGES